jgi:hypothetical protein
VQGQLLGVTSAGDYADLCVMHTVWLSTPALLSIPLSCEGEGDARHPASSPDRLSVAQLEQLSSDIFWQESVPQAGTNRAGQPGDAVILATLVDYVAERYGREKLPRLLAALGEERDGTPLAHELFGMTSAELADGWREYLAGHYEMYQGATD